MACYLVITFGKPFSGLELHEEEDGRTFIRVPFEDGLAAMQAAQEIAFTVERDPETPWQAAEIGCVVLERSDERAA